MSPPTPTTCRSPNSLSPYTVSLPCYPTPIPYRHTGPPIRSCPPPHTGSPHQVMPPTPYRVPPSGHALHPIQGPPIRSCPPPHTGPPIRSCPPPHTGSPHQVMPPTPYRSPHQVMPPTPYRSPHQVMPPTPHKSPTSGHAPHPIQVPPSGHAPNPTQVSHIRSCPHPCPAIVLRPYLIQVPQLSASLSGLHQLLEARVNTFSRLCQLQGKLDLMIAQGEAEVAQRAAMPSPADPTTG